MPVYVSKFLDKDERNPGKIASMRNEYKILRNKITDEKRISKKNYFSKKFQENKDKSSKIWKEIRSLVSLKPNNSTKIKILDDNKNILSDSQKISNIFNDHFATLGM